MTYFLGWREYELMFSYFLYTFFGMVGEKWTHHVARSNGWKDTGTKRHQKERHPVCTRYILNGGPPIGGDEVGKLYF